MLRHLIFLAALLAPAALSAYPIPLGSDSELHAVAIGYAKENPSQLSESTLKRILVGHDKPNSQIAANWRQSLNEALEKDALFEIETAQSLREEVEKSYESSATLNFEKVQLRAQSGHARVGSLLAEGQKLQAIEVARDTLQRFRDIELDRKRHPPTVVQFFEKQKEHIKNRPVGDILIKGSLSGTLYADGNLLGPVQNTTRYSLPQGTYRLWVRGGDQQSLTRLVTIGEEAQVVTFDQALDSALQVLPHHHLACDQDCARILGLFAKRLGTSNLTGLRRAAANGLFEIIKVDQSGEIQEKTLINRHGLVVQLAAPALNRTQDLSMGASNTTDFSALWLLPAGGGQFSQGRWGWGIAWATLEAGLLAWNIQAATSYYSAEPGSDARKSAENQAKISGGILYTTIAAGIIEAVLTGLLTESEPE